jgi:hypothetical protein
MRTINYPLSTLNYYLALAGLWKMGEFLLRRLRFASPPVMHFTPLAGLRAKNKNFTDILITLDNSVFVFGQDQRIGTG